MIYIIKHTYGEYEDSFTHDLFAVNSELQAKTSIEQLQIFSDTLRGFYTSEPSFWQDEVDWDDDFAVACNSKMQDICCEIGEALFFKEYGVPEHLQYLVSSYAHNSYRYGYFHYTCVPTFIEDNN